jgi:hypothetical protein
MPVERHPLDTIELYISTPFQCRTERVGDGMAASLHEVNPYKIVGRNHNAAPLTMNGGLIWADRYLIFSDALRE